MWKSPGSLEERRVFRQLITKPEVKVFRLEPFIRSQENQTSNQE
ncbi:hypothetical protein CSOJ01_09633 [Colletotrichum sojae]|uniref:Uncharacterized protein n=1 Tax=Colletotrichum sojae TaxID=2175907 RepID=A0A8H6J2E8_9PEZI|nr:hypothetical protein CSOJ01_09633 [Colletotrichum sojae]